MISLIAPTSDERIGMIPKEAEGFLYLVSSLGVTGMRNEINTDLESIVRIIRTYKKSRVRSDLAFLLRNRQKRWRGLRMA